jgi:solute carrier family 35 protein E1
MLANTSAGQILNTFPKPVTLTIIQFAFVSTWCFSLSWLSTLFPALKHHVPALRNGIRPPTRTLIATTLPLTGFMIGGHILTSDAMSRIPVSLVHTIKGLSPLFTVFAYRFMFRVHYHYTTYLSLIPLTIGVVMACSTSFTSNFLGLCSAFASAILFVTQNIVSKKLFNDAAAAEHSVGPMKSSKPDKLNLLCYSSALAFLCTMPIWLWSEGIGIIGDFLYDATVDLEIHHGSFDHGRLVLEYIFNGTFHTLQSLVAFTLLSMVSPVTYSVASLIKRVFVICFAIIWFGNSVSGVQGMGIALTFLGLYLYDRTSGHAAKSERRGRIRDMPAPLLPVHEVPTPGYTPGPVFSESPAVVSAGAGFPGYRGEGAEEEKRREEARASSQQGRSDVNGWLAPGTKAEDTWNRQDVGRHGVPVT